MAKVFCKDCKHIEINIFSTNLHTSISTPADTICNNPLNATHKIHNTTWYEIQYEITALREPEELNKNNNCIYFSKKGEG